MCPENDNLEHLDQITITVTWPDGPTAKITTTPEKAWDILNRGEIIFRWEVEGRRP